MSKKQVIKRAISKKYRKCSTRSNQKKNFDEVMEIIRDYCQCMPTNKFEPLGKEYQAALEAEFCIKEKM